MSMKLIPSILLIMLSFQGEAQVNAILAQKEIVLDSLLSELRSADNNADREAANREFKKEMESALAEPTAISFRFTKLKTVGIIDSPDNLVRIVNWNVEQEDMSHKYYCYVLYIDDKKDGVRVKELKDISFGMPSQPTEVVDADSWYGALYYKIIPVQKGSRTIYTLLGWDHNSELSQLKLIDAMYFTSSTIKFGNPIFRVGSETLNRVFFEHSKKTSMFLNYEASRSRIMMDHLSPEAPSLKNFRSYYVPDMSYDAFEYDRNKWVLIEDVVGVNDGEHSSQKQEVTVMNENTGQLEKRIVKTNWQNPEDPNAPAGGSEHVAVTPESVSGQEPLETDPKRNELDDRINKRDKRDPNQLSTVNGGRKSRFWKKKRKK